MPFLREKIYAYPIQSKVLLIYMYEQSMEKTAKEQSPTERLRFFPHFEFGNSRFCSYCGDPAKGVDHIIPYTYHRSGSRMTADRNALGPTTWACQSCNSIAGTRFFSSFDERCRFISGHLNKEASPVIWSKEELRQLDTNLRSFVEHQQNWRLWMRGRADWFESRCFLLNIENLLWVDCLNKESPTFNQFLFDHFEWTICFVKTIYK